MTRFIGTDRLNKGMPFFRYDASNRHIKQVHVPHYQSFVFMKASNHTGRTLPTL